MPQSTQIYSGFSGSIHCPKTFKSRQRTDVDDVEQSEQSHRSLEACPTSDNDNNIKAFGMMGKIMNPDSQYYKPKALATQPSQQFMRFQLY